MYKNKKADLAVTLLVFMAVALAGATLFIFINSSGKIKNNIMNARVLDKIYLTEGQLDFYLQNIFDNSVKDFSGDDADKLIDNFKQELGKYKKNGGYVLVEFVQVEQEFDKEHIKIENGKLTAEFEIKIIEIGEPLSAIYTYKKKFEKEI